MQQIWHYASRQKRKVITTIINFWTASIDLFSFGKKAFRRLVCLCPQFGSVCLLIHQNIYKRIKVYRWNKLKVTILQRCFVWSTDIMGRNCKGDSNNNIFQLKSYENQPVVPRWPHRKALDVEISEHGYSGNNINLEGYNNVTFNLI
jgi:hypothetical protein